MTNTRRIFKIAVDVLLIVLLFASLACRWTGHRMHLWAGYGWFLIVFLHAVLNWQWYRSCLRGPWPWRRWVPAVTAAALWAGTLGLLVSGVLLAHFRREIASAMLWRQIHVGCAYWLLLLCGLHAGLHAQAFLAALRQKKWFVKMQKLLTPLAWLAAAGGLWALWSLGLGQKLLFATPFAGGANSWLSLTAQAAAVFWLCAFAAYFVTKRGKVK